MRNIGILHRYLHLCHLVVSSASSRPLLTMATQFVPDVWLLGVLPTDQEHSTLAYDGLFGRLVDEKSHSGLHIGLLRSVAICATRYGTRYTISIMIRYSIGFNNFCRHIVIVRYHVKFIKCEALNVIANHIGVFMK